MKTFLSKILFFPLTLAVNYIACAGQVEVLWLGQATTKITTTTGKVIVIDPFVLKNPKTPKKYKSLDALGKVDLILITHGHRDHVADASELSKKNSAPVVANAELIRNMVSLGALPSGQKAPKHIAMNKGGTVTPLGPQIKIHMVPADHSSSIALTDAKPGSPKYAYGGAPVGYVVELENGFKIYHSGDTNVFTDMGLIRKMYAPDLALVCIGGHFTMDPKGAALAVSEFIKPKQVIPIHYGTFPPLKGTPAEFKKALGDSPIKVLDVKPGDVVRF